MGGKLLATIYISLHASKGLHMFSVGMSYYLLDLWAASRKTVVSSPFITALSKCY